MTTQQLINAYLAQNPVTTCKPAIAKGAEMPCATRDQIKDTIRK